MYINGTIMIKAVADYCINLRFIAILETIKIHSFYICNFIVIQHQEDVLIKANMNVFPRNVFRYRRSNYIAHMPPENQDNDGRSFDHCMKKNVRPTLIWVFIKIYPTFLSEVTSYKIVMTQYHAARPPGLVLESTYVIINHIFLSKTQNRLSFVLFNIRNIFNILGSGHIGNFCLIISSDVFLMGSSKKR